MVSSMLSPRPQAEKVRLGRGCGPRAWGRAQPQVKEGQLTATSCSQYPAVSNISFYPVITQTSLFLISGFKAPWSHRILENIITWAFPPNASVRIWLLSGNSTCGTNLNMREARPENSGRAGGEGLPLSFGHYAGLKLPNLKYSWPDKNKDTRRLKLKNSG